jgi:hypothetical protein
LRLLAGLTGVAALALGLVGIPFALYITGPGSIVGAGGTAVILSLIVAGLLVAGAGLVTVISGYGQRTWLLYGAGFLLYALGYTLPFVIAEGWEGFF